MSYTSFSRFAKFFVQIATFFLFFLCTSIVSFIYVLRFTQLFKVAITNSREKNDRELETIKTKVLALLQFCVYIGVRLKKKIRQYCGVNYADAMTAGAGHVTAAGLQESAENFRFFGEGRLGNCGWSFPAEVCLGADFVLDFLGVLFRDLRFCLVYL